MSEFTSVEVISFENVASELKLTEVSGMVIVDLSVLRGRLDVVSVLLPVDIDVSWFKVGVVSSFALVDILEFVTCVSVEIELQGNS